MNVIITGTFDPTAVIQEAIDDLDVSGIGPDGESEYEVTNTEVNYDGAILTVSIDVERVSGKFAAKTEVEELIVELLNDVDGFELAE